MLPPVPWMTPTPRMIVRLIYGGGLHPDSCPITFEFLCHEHRQGRVYALSHLRMVDSDRDYFVSPNADKSVQLPLASPDREEAALSNVRRSEEARPAPVPRIAARTSGSPCAIISDAR